MKAIRGASCGVLRGIVRGIVCGLMCGLLSVGCGSKEADSIAEKAGETTAAEAAKGAGATGAAAAKGGDGTAAAAATPTADLGKLSEGDWAGRILALAMQHETCATRAPAMETMAKEAEAAGQPIWAATLLGNIANCHLEKDAFDPAMAAMTRAVELGYSDCFFLRTDTNMKKLAARPDFKQLLGRIRTSPADVREVAWLASEVQAVLHDTNMMITENMNRIDGDMTQVPQSGLPTRSTTDPAVLAGRLFLLALQQNQKALVMQSDQSRISHRVNMGIIDNMGSGGGGGPSQASIQQSALLARQAAERRVQQIAARAFSDASASTKPVACSSIPD